MFAAQPNPEILREIAGLDLPSENAALKADLATIKAFLRTLSLDAAWGERAKALLHILGERE